MKTKNVLYNNSRRAQQADTLLAVVDAAIKRITKMLNDSAEDTDVDLSLADQIRILQISWLIRKEIDAEQPKEVFAYWIDDPKDPFAALPANDQIARTPGRGDEATSRPRFPKAHGLRRVK